MADVKLEQIAKRFGEVEVLTSIDLQIEDGEFVVLVGPSGCGKSTLLRLVAGLEKPSAGTISINGRRVNELAPRYRDVAMVFQSYALYPHMSVRRNMRFGLDVRKIPREQAEAEVERAAEMLGLTPLLDRLPKELSGGQRQRVAVGRAIVRRPQVFLFDEPLSNLDPALRGQMLVELRRLHQQLATTMIYVTHDQVEAMTLADRVALLDRGRLQQVGSPLDLYERPSNRFTAQFIGSPQMNVWPCCCDNGMLRGAGWSMPAPQGARLGELELGVRPHDLALCSEGDAEGMSMPFEVEVVETVGWDVQIHGLLGQGLAAVLQLPAKEAAGIAPGSRLRVAPNSGALHLFDPASGDALLRA
ncbi:MAG: ABC transporter ATP-binding protein [Candidatus Alcyoniella australis]|nr:ABC transporter ATP-binding protein [Candidatus Alcyoniella australis]